MSSNLNLQQQNKYLETQVKTASPIQLVCMLYDGAIKFANFALTGIKENNIEKKTVNIIKTEKIINELRISLNFDKGGEIASNLDKLYDFMYTYLMDANTNNDTSKLEHVIKLLVMLRESWYAIANKQTSVVQNPAVPAGNSVKAPQLQTPGANNQCGNERLDLAC